MDWRHPIDSAKRIGGAVLHHPGDLALGSLGFQPGEAETSHARQVSARCKEGVIGLSNICRA